MSEWIELERASAGMVLAADLSDANGGVLLPAGASLSEANLASLRRRGVRACLVRGAEAEAESGARALELARRQQRLAHLFRASAGAEATPQLLRLLVDYRSR